MEVKFKSEIGINNANNNVMTVQYKVLQKK